MMKMLFSASCVARLSILLWEAHRRGEISRGKLGDIAKLLDVDKDWLMKQAIDAHGGVF